MPQSLAEPRACSKSGSIQPSPTRPPTWEALLIVILTGSLENAPLAPTLIWQGSETGGGVNRPPLEICPAVADQLKLGCGDMEWPNWSSRTAENASDEPTATAADPDAGVIAIDVPTGATVTLAEALLLSPVVEL